jgi:predicted alpha/beta hydrolase
VIASEPIRIPTEDGYSLAATVFDPPAPRATEGVVLIAPAMGVRQTFYYELAEFLAERNRAVLTFDYRGIGSSAPSRLADCDADLEDWGRLDLAALIGTARVRHPDRPLAVIAHSVSGQLLGLAPNVGEVEQVLAFGAQSGYWRHWSGVRRFRVWLLWHLLIPVSTRLLGYFPASRFGLGQDTPGGVATMWAYWGRHPDYLMGRVDPEKLRGYRRYAGRLRAVCAIDDTIAPVAAVRALLEFYPEARRELRVVEPAELGVRSVGHFGYFRESIGRRLWPEETDRLGRDSAGLEAEAD